MKTITEFNAFYIKTVQATLKEIVDSGKTPEEQPAALAEALKLDGDKPKLLLAALEISRNKMDGLKRIIVLTAAENEKIPAGIQKVEEHYFLMEHFPRPVEKQGRGRPGDARGERKGRGGKRGRDDKRGGRDDKRGGRDSRPSRPRGEPRAEISLKSGPNAGVKIVISPSATGENAGAAESRRPPRSRRPRRPFAPKGPAAAPGAPLPVIKPNNPEALAAFRQANLEKSATTATSVASTAPSAPESTSTPTSGETTSGT